MTLPLWRFILLALIAGVAGIMTLAWYFPGTSDFHPENPFWNGLTNVRTRYGAESIQNFTELPQDPRNSVLVMMPVSDPTPEDLDMLRTYVRTGGTLLLADDWYFGNSVLEALGVPARLTHVPLQDSALNARDRWFPIIPAVETSPLTVGVNDLTFNYGTALGGAGLTFLAHSSLFSYLDDNKNSRLDNGERIGPFPVVGYTSIDSGRLIVVADSSVFLNTMDEFSGNVQFLDNVIASAGEGPRVLIDQAHLPPARLDATKSFLTFAHRIMGQPIILSLLTVLSLSCLLPLWRRKGGLDWSR